MNIVKGSGKVHYTSGDTVSAPSCNPWKGAAGFRATAAEVTCKKCLTWIETNEAKDEPVIVQVVKASVDGSAFIGCDADDNVYDLDANKKIIGRRAN